MINIYEGYRDYNGNSINDRTILFLRNSDIDEDGSIKTYAAGPGVSDDVSGRVLIVDDWLIPQIDKVKFVDGVLSVKDGEELNQPVKTDKQKEMEELQRRMAELQAMPDEPAVTEEIPTKININTADSSELMSLEGIGGTKANAIVDYRNVNGLFVQIVDIMNVPGIAAETYAIIEQYITV